VRSITISIYKSLPLHQTDSGLAEGTFGIIETRKTCDEFTMLCLLSRRRSEADLYNLDARYTQAYILYTLASVACRKSVLANYNDVITGLL